MQGGFLRKRAASCKPEGTARRIAGGTGTENGASIEFVAPRKQPSEAGVGAMVADDHADCPGSMSGHVHCAASENDGRELEKCAGEPRCADKKALRGANRAERIPDDWGIFVGRALICRRGVRL